MRVACLGGGPAGLYFAIAMKLRDPGHEIVVVERNRPYDTFGWGVVLSDETLANLKAADPVSAAEIARGFVYWDDIATHYRGTVARSSGHGFCGIGRKRLLNILQDRARALGVELQFETEIEGLEPYKGCDLIVACDGANSKVRSTLAHVFRPDIDVRRTKYIWLGTHQKFD
ncbi:MAG TPA: FAD-dependent monooxygenase, partial [Hyphomicrobiaceae bacterium]|nr:FAD-dependent monooxygenase [Hyphomicrobiaceae bacterium]